MLMIGAQVISTTEGAMIRLRIDELLEERGKSAYWLAREAGLTDTGLFRLRHRKTRAIKFDTIEKLCKALECEPSDLFSITEEKTDGRKSASKKP